MSIPDKPSITCICLTYCRPEFLKRSISCFLSQTYRNKSLLIVYRKEDEHTAQLIKSYDSEIIQPLEVDFANRTSLGETRNYAISKCKGEYFCQWDDDDWCHNLRLEMQMKAIQENYKSASILGHWLLYDKPKNDAYISHYGAWAGSILCKKSIITDQNKYPNLAKREDSEFIKKLFEINCLYPLVCPTMYIYVYHGGNTWNSKHFAHLFTYSKKLPQHVANLLSQILDGSLSNEEACKELNDENVLKEMDYFYYVDPGTKNGNYYLRKIILEPFKYLFGLVSGKKVKVSKTK